MKNKSSVVKKSLKGSSGVMIGLFMLLAGVCPIVQGHQLEIPILTNASEINQSESDTLNELTECVLAVGTLAASQGKLPLEETVLVTYARLSGHDNITLKVQNWPVIQGSPKSKECSGTGHGIIKVRCLVNGCQNVDSKRIIVKEKAQRMVVVWSAGVQRRKKRGTIKEALDKLKALSEEMARVTHRKSWWDWSQTQSRTAVVERTALIIALIIAFQALVSCFAIPVVQYMVKKKMSVTAPVQHPINPGVNVQCQTLMMTAMR